MKNLIVPFLIAAGMMLSGCWTFNESQYPTVEYSAPRSSATNLTLAVTGYECVFSGYESVQGFSTVYMPGYYGRRYYVPGRYETVSTVTYVPTRRASDMFLVRSRELFEQAGYSLGAMVPTYSVEVRFEGPYSTMADFNKSLGWMLCTVFFCDYSSSTWTAKLKIRDNSTGKLLFHRTYEQRYEANVFSLIPLFGPQSCHETTLEQMQIWCLSALTERTVADATAFLSTIE